MNNTISNGDVNITMDDASDKNTDLLTTSTTLAT